MRYGGKTLRHTGGAAAAEMAMVLPFLLALLFGSAELGNYFLDEHGLVKQVRDGARYAARIPLETNYTCPGTVSPAAQSLITNVTQTGTVTGTGAGRLNASYWARSCGGASQTVTITIRCVSKDDYDGIYQSLPGDIPVVKVSAAVGYRSLLGSLGLPTANACIRAESEAPVIGS
ncbi:TadE/TadG family type IV pilus assembly protein [Sphingomonas edaphi]|uniref:Pilus assembly protein n=1 Tax=Sphingomonas edaphi TaxID=2315689 RepID=A0A418Q3G9_9SPHN|nr:TadE/TadG family type IV pilus assembly protein [Sphingomonas edaphi]RIX32441.1 pilus assembly protein [Sphingomonas edaphi]